MKNPERYYDYVLLDPRKPSKESYRGGPSLFEYEPFYFGYSGREERIDEHLGCYDSDKNIDKKEIIKEIRKAGKEPISIKILENVDIYIAKKKETELIIYYGRLNEGTGPLTNKTNGGEGQNGKRNSKEHNEKISKAHTGKKRSKEACENMSKAQKGKIPWNKGKKRDKFSDEWCENMSIGTIEFYNSEEGAERKKQQREEVLGEKNNFYGKTHTKESKKKQSVWQKDVPKSDEHVKKTTEGVRRAWQRKYLLRVMKQILFVKSN